MIGKIRLIIELGGVDLAMEVSVMALTMAIPSEGRLKLVFQFFHCSKSNEVELLFLILQSLTFT